MDWRACEDELNFMRLRQIENLIERENEICEKRQYLEKRVRDSMASSYLASRSEL